MKLHIEQLRLQRGQRSLCQPFNMTVESGQCWGILGSNGSGKTTLLHTLAGLHHDYRGTVKLDDTPIEEIPRKQFAQQVGLLLQSNEEAFPGSVLETVLTGRHPHLKAWQWESHGDYSLSLEALEQVDLREFGQRNIQTLSGGERRRMYIATLLVQQPELYLLDEPVNHLDLRHQHQILGQLQQLSAKHNKALLMVLHDPNLASRYCDHILLLHQNGQVESGEKETLLIPDKLTELYGYPIRQIETGQRAVFIAG